MTINVEEKIGRLESAHRRTVEKRAAELMAEEVTQRGLRKAQQFTPVGVRPNSEAARTADGSGPTSTRHDGTERSG